MKHIKYTKELLEDAAKNCVSVYGIQRYLGLKLSGGSNSHIKRKLIEYNIDISHFTGRASNCGENHKGGRVLRPEDVLVKRDSGRRQASKHLRWAMLESGIEYKCSECGAGYVYNNKPIAHQVDHLNNDWLDDRLENLRFLCPNCHSQTIGWCGQKALLDTYRLTGRMNPKKYKTVKYSDNLNNDPIKDRKKREPRIEHPCLVCGKVIKRGKYCSYECMRKGQRKFNPTKEELENLIKQYPMTTIGKMFGVSDNAVRKRAELLGISVPKRLGFWLRLKANKIHKHKPLFDN